MELRDKFGRYIKGSNHKRNVEPMIVWHKENGYWNTGLTKETDERVKNIGIKSGLARKGISISDERKKKMSNSHKGKKLSEETKDKLRLKFSNEQIKEICERYDKFNISLSILAKEYNCSYSSLYKIILKNKIPIKGTRFFNSIREFSEETRNKMSKAFTGRKAWNKGFKGYHSGKEHQFYGKKRPKETIEKIKIARAKQVFPMKDTSIEIKIQNFLKELGVGFFTHQYISEIPHAYQGDIFIPVQRNREMFIRQPIIVECDGDYWHGNPKLEYIWKDKEYIHKRIERDKIRTEELKERGFIIIRLWESEIRGLTLKRFNLIINKLKETQNEKSQESNLPELQENELPKNNS